MADVHRTGPPTPTRRKALRLRDDACTGKTAESRAVPGQRCAGQMPPRRARSMLVVGVRLKPTAV